jgi:hypothetical protein
LQDVKVPGRNPGCFSYTKGYNNRAGHCASPVVALGGAFSKICGKDLYKSLDKFNKPD